MKSSRALFKEYDIYHLIKDRFYAYYHVNPPGTVDEFIELIKSPEFSHPYNQEIIFGQVLRRVLQDLYKGDSMASEIDDGKSVPGLMLGKLTTAMGANLILYFVGQKKGYEAAPVPSPKFDIHLFYQDQHGGHYEFVYVDEAMSKLHEEQFGVAPAYSKKERPPRHDGRYYDAVNILGVDKQIEVIEGLVKGSIKALRAPVRPIPRPTPIIITKPKPKPVPVPVIKWPPPPPPLPPGEPSSPDSSSSEEEDSPVIPNKVPPPPPPGEPTSPDSSSSEEEEESPVLPNKAPPPPPGEPSSPSTGSSSEDEEEEPPPAPKGPPPPRSTGSTSSDDEESPLPTKKGPKGPSGR